ncbi:phosphatidylserine decarboxylase [Spartinivicinus poritis]|uniref:Phosphatidylserine decarboxylase n=1 Tax=Spartinivicinus poritis TaxID=2994640 RepID=A0ABT5UGF4_9GAMM|nr:phosphatidylserine decarboxylase [Spartinivicinus sp. A2-2]MDE1465456.1 phosphatidylserine decarboxylase [Spartinivicinus sp. A2-2]
MSSKFRTHSPRHRLATAQDLQNAIKRGPLAETGKELPCQPRPFLAGLPPVGSLYEPQQEATKQLKHIIETNYYASSFENAIKEVSKQRIPELESIKTLDQFYFYVDALVTWIPEIRVWDWYGEVLHERTVYLRITQFYYYFNQPQLEALQSPIEPQEGKELSSISLWLRNFAVEWGDFLNTDASSEYLSSFKYAPEYAWQDYQKPPEEYPSFNAFFARQFKDINVQRPVAQPHNDQVIVFPAESTFVGQWAVSTKVGLPLPAPPSIVVKNIEWSIQELLQDSAYADAFEGGIFCHSFLNTYDYHRLHTSVAGEVLEAKFIPGQVYLEVELTVNPDEEGNKEPARAVIPRRLLDAEDNTGYQFVQCRGLLVLESAIGKVAILPMGMAQVSSVVFVTPKDEGHQPIMLTEEEKSGLDYDQQVKMLNEKIAGTLRGKKLSKGEMFSYFQFGGSDCVMVFERKANINVTAQPNVHYPIRSQYATANC